MKSDINPANEFIRKIQNDDKLNNYFQSIKLYNQAIDDIHSERNDLAMMKLYKSIDLNGNNVKSMLLLSINLSMTI